MFPPDFDELLARVNFIEPARARPRLFELADDPAEILALAAILSELGDALESCADADQALNQFGRYVHARGARLALYHRFKDQPAALARLIRVLAASQYLADVLVRNPEYFEVIADSALLGTLCSTENLSEELDRICDPFPAAAARLDAVRRFRRREILRIGTADLCGFLDLSQVTRQLSCLADAIVAQCLRIVSSEAAPSDLIVLALGKLGGNELNYSSDIDLIFVTEHANRLESAVRLARSLTAALGEATGEGFLYRVDLRLRPFGSGGSLVVSTAMFEDYLGTNAHPAERQAMLKARPIAGDTPSGDALLERMRPLLLGDAASARGQVHQLKRRIEEQLHSRGQAAGHVKLAPGGIRDIEFLIQAMQLECGAGYPEVITGNTLQALARLVEAGLFEADDAHRLREAYIFLRLVEHRLQLMNNQQVHRLPDSAVELRLLARSLGFQSPDEARQLKDAYEERAARVRTIFERLLSVEQASRLLAADTSEDACATAGSRLLAQISQPHDVAVFAQRESHQRWTVTVAMWDHIGILSILAGLITAHNIDILSGDVVSLQFAEPPRERPRKGPARRVRSARRTLRKARDVFVVQVPQWVDAPFWDRFRKELAEVTGLVAEGNLEAARERVIDRVSSSARLTSSQAGVQTALFPIAIDVDNDASPEATLLTIRSTNTVGFLFEFAGALALLNVNIQRVEVRTIHQEVRDTFWVTDAQRRKIIDRERIHELRVAAALIKQFTHLLPRSPNPAQALRQFSALTRQMLSRPDWVADVQSLESDAVLRTLADLMGVSQFLWEDFLREQHENLFPVVQDFPALNQAKTTEQLRNELTDRSPHAPREECISWSRPAERAPRPTMASRLNRFKDREMFRIDLRHITRRIDLVQFSHELTDLAEVVVERACELCHERLYENFGAPRLKNGQECGWCVCGLGKFGGRELGFASDIELIVVYQGEGLTSGPSSISNARYFEEFVSTFLQTLVARREGVFEIDLRLRPHGKAGALACSLEGFLRYFAEGGEAQQFERLALVKLRPVAGDARLGQTVQEGRDQFVYSSQPLDYENILHLRQRQAIELVPPGTTSAKHSPGGLVDVEYFVQARQIEFGCNNVHVRATETLDAIHQLQQAGALPADTAREMAESYRFLRQLIEALRVVRGNAKDLSIPAPIQREFTHLARRMNYDSPSDFAGEIEERMRFAQQLWEQRNTNLH